MSAHLTPLRNDAPRRYARDSGARPARAARPEPSFRREAAPDLPGQITSSRNSRGRYRRATAATQLMAIHELELDALAQTREQRRPVSGKDRLHKELVLVDQSRSANARGSVTPPTNRPSPGSAPTATVEKLPPTVFEWALVRLNRSSFRGRLMRSRMIIAVVVLTASLGGYAWFPGGTAPSADPAKAPSAGCATATPRAPGVATMNITSGGVARTYLQRIPAGYDATNPAPVVFAIHGWGEGAQVHTSMSEWAPRADANGFVVIYPQGLGSPVGWNTTLGSSDLAYIGHVLDQVEDDLCLDRRRVSRRASPWAPSCRRRSPASSRNGSRQWRSWPEYATPRAAHRAGPCPP